MYIYLGFICSIQKSGTMFRFYKKKKCRINDTPL